MGGGPGDEKIRELAREMNPRQVGDLYRVTRQTAEHWFRNAGIPSGARRLSHKTFLPWELSRAHAWDGIARALRAWSTEAQGAPVSREQRWELEKLRRFLTAENAIVAYSRVDGFTFPDRDPEIDDPDLPIRRP